MYKAHADLVIYPEESGSDLLGAIILPDGALEVSSRMWVFTVAEGPDPFTPTEFVILSMLNRRSYKSPKLVSVQDNRVILRVFGEEVAPSGTLTNRMSMLYIAILPPGTFEWNDDPNLHPKLRP